MEIPQCCKTVIAQEATYGELIKALPAPKSKKLPPIEKLRRSASVILRKKMDYCTLEVFDNGLCVCTRDDKCKIFSVVLFGVLKNAFNFDGTIKPEFAELDKTPWWEPLESAGMERLCCIFDKATGVWFEVAQNEFADYNRFRSRIRRREKYHNRCKSPRMKWWLCDGMCQDCEFHTGSGELSLDSSWENEDGDEAFMMDEIASSEFDPNETVPPKLLSKQLINRLCELMPEAPEIAQMRLLGMTDESIAEAIGINRMTFRTRIEAARQVLRKEYGDAFDF